MKGPAIAASLLLLVYTATAIHATQVQGQGSAVLAFEVASVKPSNPDPANPLSALPMILPSGGRRLAASNTPLKNLVLGAYELQDFHLSPSCSCSAVRSDGAFDGGNEFAGMLIPSFATMRIRVAKP